MERPATKTHIDNRLDEALAESFPASDPPAVHISDDPPRRGPRARRPVPNRKRAAARASGATKRKPPASRRAKTKRNTRKRR